MKIYVREKVSFVGGHILLDSEGELFLVSRDIAREEKVERFMSRLEDAGDEREGGNE